MLGHWKGPIVYCRQKWSPSFRLEKTGQATPIGNFRGTVVLELEGDSLTNKAQLSILHVKGSKGTLFLIDREPVTVLDSCGGFGHANMQVTFSGIQNWVLGTGSWEPVRP
jgi:hypothetical protein